MLKRNEVTEKLDWLVKGILNVVISHWDEEDNNYYFFWQDNNGILNGFVLYDFMPGNLIRLALNHESVLYLPTRATKLLEIKNPDKNPAWSCHLTFLPKDFAKVLGWLCLMIKATNKAKYLDEKLPRGFISLGNENFTQNKYFFSKPALKIIKSK